MEESGKIKYREKEEANMEWNNEIKENFDNISKKLRVIFLKMQEGKTTIEIDGKNITIIVRDIGDGYYKSYYESDEEFRIQKQISIIDENNFNFLIIDYYDIYSHRSNGGSFLFREKFFFPANEKYQNGYELIYDFKDFRAGGDLKYTKDGVQYYIGLGDCYLPTIIRTSDKKDIFVIKNNIMYKKIKKLENTEFGVNIENENIKINEESIDLEVIKDIKNMIKIYKDSKDIIMKFSHKEIVEKIMKLIINKFKIDFENQNIEIYPLEEINKSDSMLNPNLEEIRKFSKVNNRKFKKRISKYKKNIRNLNLKNKMKKLTKKYRSNRN